MEKSGEIGEMMASKIFEEAQAEKNTPEE